MPVGDHQREQSLTEGDLVVRHVAEDGERFAVYDFGSLPVANQLRREFAETFARRVGPDGTWRSIASSREMWLIALYFARFVATLQPPPSAVKDLTPSLWAAFKLSRPATTVGPVQLRKMATFLRDHPQLPHETRLLMLTQRIPNAVVRETAYSDAEFDELKKAAARRFRVALQRIRQGREHLERWRAGQFAPATREHLVGEALDHLVQCGEAPSYIGTDGRKRIVSAYATALGGKGPEHTWMRLFLGGDEACSLVVLFVAAYGWNVTPVMELRIPDSSPDAGNPDQIIHRIELEKRRRGAASQFETRNLADWGTNSPGRLVTQALEATWAARETLAHLGAPSDRLIIWRRGWSSRSVAGDPSRLFETGWQDNVWRNRRTSFGEDVSLNLRRLRRTVVIAHRRTPTQHTRETHDTRYVLPDPRTHAEAAPKISAGVADAIAAAYTTFRARASRTDSDPSRDTATTGCTGYHASPFSEPGEPCRASFLACTACQNAVVTPRHLPRLAYLHQALGELRTVLGQEIWQQDWGASFQRLHDLISGPHFTSTEWDDALRQVTAVDRDRVNQLLRRSFDS